MDLKQEYDFDESTVASECSELQNINSVLELSFTNEELKKMSFFQKKVFWTKLACDSLRIEDILVKMSKKVKINIKECKVSIKVGQNTLDEYADYFKNKLANENKRNVKLPNFNPKKLVSTIG